MHQFSNLIELKNFENNELFTLGKAVRTAI